MKKKLGAAEWRKKEILVALIAEEDVVEDLFGKPSYEELMKDAKKTKEIRFQEAIEAKKGTQEEK